MNVIKKVIHKIGTIFIGEATVPKLKLFALSMNLLGIAISSSSVFAFVGFMVVDFGLVPTERDAGEYAGYIAGAFWLGAIVGVLIGGYAADRIGRRPILLGATLVNVLTTIAFGFSPNFFWAFTLRLIGGFFSPNFIVSKSYINDICDKSNRSAAFAVISMSFGIGSLIGPLIGGLMSRPALKHPATFDKDGIFGQFPYALQGIVIGFILLASFLICWFWLPESKDLTNGVETPEEDGGIDMQPLLKDDAEGSDNSGEAAVVLLDETPTGNEFDKKMQSGSDVDESLTTNLTLMSDDPTASMTPGQVNWLVAKCVALYTILSFLTSGRDETIALWLMTDVPHGGLGFNTDQVGFVLSLKGITIIVAQILYVGVASRIGALKVYKYTSIIYAIGLLGFSLCSLIARHVPSLVWPFLILLSILNSSDALCFTSVNVLINAAAPRDKSGKFNGIAGCCASVTRTLGPFLFAPVFAWSANQSYSFPLDTGFVFNVSCVLSIIMFIMTFTIPKNLG